MIIVKNLHKYYKMKKGRTFHALKGLNIKFPNKGFVFITGKSGCGKSTLLNVIGGLDTYEKGKLVISGKSTREFTKRDMDNYRNSYLGFIFQDFNLIDGETIYDNVALALKLQGYSKDDIHKRVKHYLQIVDLYDKRYNKISEISGGQKQRVAIARALIKNPKVIIADEPTGNLDSKTGELIMRILKKLSESKLVIMVTHDIEYALKYADRIITLKDGVVVKDDSKNQLDYKLNKRLRFKRSVFPFQVALKMAWSSVVRKKIRLVFTVLLFAISIGLFSFTNSFNFYNTEDLFYEFALDTNLNKIEFSEGRDEYYQYKTILDDNQLSILKLRYPNVTFGRVDYSPKFAINDCGYNEQLCRITGKTAYINDASKLNLKMIAGTSNLKSNSIIISDIIANYLINDSGYTNYKQLIGQTGQDVADNGTDNEFHSAEIIGIYETKMIDVIKDYDSQMSVGSFEDYQNLENIRNYYIYAHTDLDDYVETLDVNGKTNYSEFSYFQMAKDATGIVAGSLPKTENEILLNFNTANEIITGMLYSFVDEGIISDSQAQEKLSSYPIDDICIEYSENFNKGDCITMLEDYIIDINNMFDIQDKSFELEITPSTYNRKTYKEEYLDPMTFTKVTGISTGGYGIVVSKDAYNKYIEDIKRSRGNTFSQPHNIVAILKGSVSSNEDFIKYIDKEFSHQTKASMGLNVIDGFMNKTVMRVFLIISLILGGFAALLMFSYINQSIRFKRSDIGTLRAIGAKGIDVGKIFITEAMIISLISSVFAVGGLIYAVSKLNQTINSTLKLSFNFFYINYIVYFILLIFAATIALISCALPLTKLIRMNPIDVIRKARD